LRKLKVSFGAFSFLYEPDYSVQTTRVTRKLPRKAQPVAIRVRYTWRVGFNG
jgi:hypothetical protein